MPNNPIIGVLLASVTALLALLAAFGGADAARRNHEWILLIAVVVVVLALVLGGVTAIVTQPKATKDQKVLAGIGVGVLAAGLIVAAWAALDHHSGRPEISASLIAGPPQHITGTITRDGLGAKDQMEAAVQGYSSDDGTGDPVDTLYRSSFGPDESGKANLTFEVPVPQANTAIKSILIRTWVKSDDPALDLSCSTTNTNANKDIKHWASCVLFVLP